MKNKENIIEDYQQMVYKSWTYEKMTPQEKHQWAEVLDLLQITEALKGTYKQRWAILQAIYFSFIMGLGYTGWNWREESESTF